MANNQPGRALVSMIGAVLGVCAAASAASGADVVCYEKIPLRPVYRTFHHRDVVEPGVYEVLQAPGQHGWLLGGPNEGDEGPRSVLLRPYKNYTRFHAPKLRFWSERVRIQPEGYRWRRVRVHREC